MALEGARGVEGDFTPLPGLVRKGAQAGNVQKALAASLGCSCICQRLGAGKEGWDGAWACTGLEEMSWAKVLAAAPRQRASLACCEFPQTSRKFRMSWEVVIFPAQVRCKLFPSREVFAGWAAGAMCLSQPASSLAAGGFGGEMEWAMEQAMETKLLSFFPCLLLHPIYPSHAVPTGQISTRLLSLRLSTWHLPPWLNTL